jgi:hypothetical protein
MESENATYEVQLKRINARLYPVRVTPIPHGTWGLQVWKNYKPLLRYWAWMTIPDTRNPLNDTGFSTWTLCFTLREPPVEYLDKTHHDGIVNFLAGDEAPHHLMVAGFTFDLFVGPGGTIARGQILESSDAAQ